MNMRNIALGTIVLCLFATSAFGVVAPDDGRIHDSVSDISKDTGTPGRQISIVGREQMDRLSSQYGATLRSGYVIAAILYKHSPRVIISNDIPVDAPLIYLVSQGDQPANLAIYQLDQSKPLAHARDLLDPQCYAGPDVAGPVAPGMNPPPSPDGLPEGITQDKNDPHIMHATHPAITKVGEKLGIFLRPGFHIASLNIMLPPETGGTYVRVLDDASQTKPVKGIIIGVPSQEFTALIIRDDGKDLSNDTKITDVVLPITRPRNKP
jgi:hypothetical protein